MDGTWTRLATLAAGIWLVAGPCAGAERHRLGHSTYLGGDSEEEVWDLAVDAAGNVYVAGFTYSTDYPVVGGLQPDQPGEDAFVTKISPTGEVVYSTILGGSGEDRAYAVAVDATGAAYVTGYTTSADFPRVGSGPGTGGGPIDAFVAKLAPDGASLEYSVLFGGTSWDYGFDIAVGAGGDAFVTGWTYSLDFPLVNAWQSSPHGGADAFVARIDPTGTTFLYSTYLGGIDKEYSRGIAVDAAGNAYVTGATWSPDFPTAHAVQPVYGAGGDGYVAKLAPDGSLVYASFLGGKQYDVGTSVTVDAAGGAYVVGGTASADFPLATPLQPDQAGNDAFLARLSPDGTALVWSTYLGGASWEEASDVTLDSQGRVLVTGYTGSPDFPPRGPALRRRTLAPFDAFVLRLDGPHTIGDSARVGGTSDDYGMGIGVDAAGRVYVAGMTFSEDFPLRHAAYGDAPYLDACVFRLDPPLSGRRQR